MGVDDQLGAVDLAERAARRALDRAGLAARDLGALVTVESRAPETLLSSEPTRLQHLLGAETATVFSVGASAASRSRLRSSWPAVCAQPTGRRTTS
ncbi:hypothetical protein ACIHCQ_05625 [Streptomyces sp. NPDC052236]|uniref:hypothetical protein n=1 Tax=Streptomyces sp. NPDC052236 TaxID=3365686 RepID=UPI0037D4DF97